MVLGEPVPGYLTSGWRFVTADAHNITQTLRDQFPSTRLACSPTHYEGDQRIGVLEFFRLEHMNKRDVADLEDLNESPVKVDGGVWLVALLPRDPVTGEPLRGEPDDRVLKAVRKYDTRRHSSTFDAKQWQTWAEGQARRVEVKQKEENMEAMRENAELWFHHQMKGRGDRPTYIYVPQNVKV